MKKKFLMLSVMGLLRGQCDAQISSSNFESQIDFSTATSPKGIASGDIDGDGKIDLAVANNGSASISVFRNVSTIGNLGSCSFESKVDFTTGTNPTIVKLGDIDGDGKLDMVVSNWGSNTFSVLRNTSSSGSISFAAKVDFTTGTNPLGLALGDMDGDGDLDVAVADNGSNTISVFINTSSSGTVSFAARLAFGSASSPGMIVIGELNETGNPEIVVSNRYADKISVYKNLYTSGTFGSGSLDTRIEYATISNGQPVYVAIDDLDGAGGNDILVSYWNSTNFSAFRNTHSGATISLNTRQDFTTGSHPMEMFVSDVDNDGKKDVSIAIFGAHVNSIFQNTSTSGTIAFASGTDFSTGSVSYPHCILLADLDGDNKPDIANTDNDINKISVFRNTTATSTFSNHIDFSTATTPKGIASGDIDGDGKIDLVVANYGSASISVFRNVSTTGSLGSCSFESKVDFTTGTNPSIVKLGDIDGDGKLDMVVSNWTSGTFSVLRNTSSSGSISFATKVDFTTGTNPLGLSLGNLDGDGDLDVAIAENGSNTFGVFINTSSSGTVSFATRIAFSTAANPSMITIGELNETGNPEILVSNRYADKISVYKNLYTSGTFTTASLDNAIEYATISSSSPVYVAIDDMDGAGGNDILLSYWNSTNFSAFRNTHSGATIAFNTRQDFTTGTHPMEMFLSDIDGDSKKDVAIAIFGGNVNSVFQNSSTSGTISFASAVDYSTGTGSSPHNILLADFDGDSKPDMANTNYDNNKMSVFRNKSTGATIRMFSMQQEDLTNEMNSSTMLLFPNPTRESCTLRFYNEHEEKSTIQLLDFTGKLIETIADENFSGGQQYDIQFETNKLAKGMYLVVKKSTNNCVYKKLIVQ